MLVIYKDLRGYCVTSEANYNAFIQDARKVQQAYDFKSPDEIIAYYGKYFHTDVTDFKVVTK